MKNYQKHYMPLMLGEFERARKEFEQNRKEGDPIGKHQIAVKVLERAESQIALIYMCDCMHEMIEELQKKGMEDEANLKEQGDKITKLEEQVIKLMLRINDYENDKRTDNDGALQSPGNDSGEDKG